MADMTAACPCCGGALDVPSLDDLIEKARLDDPTANVLTALWDAGGLPVPAGELFDVIFADDPDGGPEVSAMYRHLRRVMALLSSRLAGVGVSISHMERRGWRIEFMEQAHDPNSMPVLS